MCINVIARVTKIVRHARLQKSGVTRPQNRSVTRPQNRSVTRPRSRSVTPHQNRSVTRHQNRSATRPQKVCQMRHGDQKCSLSLAKTILFGRGVIAARPQNHVLQGVRIMFCRASDSMCHKASESCIARRQISCATRRQISCGTRLQNCV